MLSSKKNTPAPIEIDSSLDHPKFAITTSLNPSDVHEGWSSFNKKIKSRNCLSFIKRLLAKKIPIGKNLFLINEK